MAVQKVGIYFAVARQLPTDRMISRGCFDAPSEAAGRVSRDVSGVNTSGAEIVRGFAGAALIDGLRASNDAGRTESLLMGILTCRPRKFLGDAESSAEAPTTF